MRYYTTWVETSENGLSGGLPSAGSGSASAFTSSDGSVGMTSTRSKESRSTSTSNDGKNQSDDDEEEEDERSRNSTSTVSERHLPTNGGGFSIDDFDDFDDSTRTTTTTEISGSRGSFPSIHFDRSGSPGTDEDEEESDEGISSGSSEGELVGGIRFGGGLFGRESGVGSGAVGGVGGRRRPRTGTVVGDRGTVHPMAIQNGNGNGVGGVGGGRTEVPFGLTMPTVTRTLYIQMEFVERQTLREVSFYFVSLTYLWS